MLYKSKDDEIKCLKSRLEEAIKSIGELQLLVIQKQKENEQARTDAWSMMERWIDTKDKLDVYRQAEEQGLLIKLPCKVVDMVYMLYRVFDVETGITREEIEQGVISELRGNKFNPIWYLVDCKTHRRDFHPAEIGKTVFLTREAAESAMKGGSL